MVFTYGERPIFGHVKIKLKIIILDILMSMFLYMTLKNIFLSVSSLYGY
jgi:hypothetical protein